jgi:hypothetical protein
MGTFSFQGRDTPLGQMNQGSSLILYSSSEQDANPNAQNTNGTSIRPAGGPLNTASDGSNLNMVIDIDQAAKSGMPINDYVALQIGESLFNNVVYVYHQNPDGTINPQIQAAFSGGSGLAQVVNQSLTKGGYVVLAACYGVNYKTGLVNNPSFVQGIANAYGREESVIVSGTGKTHTGEYGSTPSTVVRGPSGGYEALYDPATEINIFWGGQYTDPDAVTTWTVVPAGN